MRIMEAMQVSLKDVFTVRRDSLQEYELWSILFQTTQAVQNVFLRGHAIQNGIVNFIVTPDNLHFTPHGLIVIETCSVESIKGTKYWCPEMTDSNFYSISSNLEKIYVFTIGQTLMDAAFFDIDFKAKKKLSPLLKTVLLAMCQKDVELRMLLIDIIEVCNSYAYKHMNGYDFSTPIIVLYNQVCDSLPKRISLSQVGEDVTNKDKTVKNECAGESFPKAGNVPNDCSEECSPCKHPEFDVNQKYCFTPKERWKKACSRVIRQMKNSKNLETFENHGSYERVFKESRELTERQKFLGLSISPGSPLPVTAESKPKTCAVGEKLPVSSQSQPLLTSKHLKMPNNSCSSHTTTENIPETSFARPNFASFYYDLQSTLSCNHSTQADLNSLPGPEFVLGRLKPLINISLLSNDCLDYPTDVLYISVLLLTGDSIEVECLPSTTGKQLFNAVADHIKLHEKYLFGIASESGGEYIFIDRKQKCSDFLKISSLESFSTVHKLFFRVKFYLDDIHLMRCQTLRHLFYLQLRTNFLSNDFCPDSAIAVQLGGLALQAEFGNYCNSYGQDYFLLEHYAPYQCLKPLSDRSVIKSKLQDCHGRLAGVSREMAEAEFITNMMQIPEYGCHFHKVYLDKNHLSSDAWLGIKPMGIEVHESNLKEQSLRLQYKWQDILRISFTKKCFCLVPKFESGKHIVHRFYTPMLHRSLYLFNIAMAHHKFHLKLIALTKSSETFDEDLDCENSYSPNTSMEKEISSNHGAEDTTNCEADPRNETTVLSLKKYSFTDLTNLPSFKSCTEDVVILSSKGSGRILRKKRNSYCIKRSSSDPIRKNFTHILSKEQLKQSRTSSLGDDPREQNVRKVCVKKNVESGLGFGINCGYSSENSLQGAFVESVAPESPVDLDGKIKPVVDLIQCAQNPVKLVVSKATSISTSPVDISIERTKNSFSESSWTSEDQKSDSTIIAECSYNSEMPVPKPRKKLSERQSSGPLLDVPDLTINHPKLSSKNAHDNGQFSDDNHIENWSVPDIIASQVKHVGPSELANCSSNSGDERAFFSVLDKSDLLPGEVFHVVLDKKGGSLGLNIYQGSENGFNYQKHIYVHSVIPNGAAESDGRIQPGDKLLEVNGISLENLSYQEVVLTLRETSQVAHLVFEKGIGYSQRDEMERPRTPSSMDSKTEFSFSTEEDRSLEFKTLCPKLVLSKEPGYESPRGSPAGSKSSSSLLNCNAKNHSPLLASRYEGLLKNNDYSSVDYLDVKLLDNYKPSPPFAKDKTRFHNQMTSYKSTPNLADSSSDEEDTKSGCSLYRNKSTDCLLESPFVSPSHNLIDLYHNLYYSQIRGSSCNIHQIPAVPIRKKKLKKLEDIKNLCSAENTFVVSIPKSSRGLGISITGGKNPSKDMFSQLIRIRKLYPLQPALECGKLQLGDVILEVNGTSMVGLTNREALEVLRCAPKDVMLKMFRPSKSLIPALSAFKGGIWPGVHSSSSSASSSLSRPDKNSYNVETGEFEVTLLKQDGTLGFTIIRKDKTAECPAGIYIKALVREHAVSDGRIQPGDRILEVNGKDITSLSHTEALASLRNSTDKVTLKLYREDPPLTPNGLEEEYTIAKPLRWEAVELLNDRIKQKDSSNDDSNLLKKKIKRKRDRLSNPSSNSSSNSTCSSSSLGQELAMGHETAAMDPLDDQPSGIGMQRNLRPKSLDVLNSSDRKRLAGQQSDEDSFRRQSSVMCGNAESKLKSEGTETTDTSRNGGGTLLKWRGSTLDGSEGVTGGMDTIQESVVSSPPHSLNPEKQESAEEAVPKEDDVDYKPVPYPRTTSYNSEWINIFNVNIDRGWHSRLGFTLCDPPDVGQVENNKVSLPKAAKVKAVFPGSLADKDGRIKVGDCLAEVNGESMLGKPASEVIDILRKTRGVTRLVIWRLEKQS